MVTTPGADPSKRHGNFQRRWTPNGEPRGHPEIEVFRRTVFEHYHEDKVETDDDIADVLFQRVR